MPSGVTARLSSERLFRTPLTPGPAGVYFAGRLNCRTNVPSGFISRTKGETSAAALPSLAQSSRPAVGLRRIASASTVLAANAPPAVSVSVVTLLNVTPLTLARSNRRSSE